MTISDEEKRKIMNDLAFGNPKMFNQEPSHQLAPDEKTFEAQDYQNFDDFAQRDSRAQRQKIFSKAFNPETIELAMLNQIDQRANYN